MCIRDSLGTLKLTLKTIVFYKFSTLSLLVLENGILYFKNYTLQCQNICIFKVYLSREAWLFCVYHYANSTNKIIALGSTYYICRPTNIVGRPTRVSDQNEMCIRDSRSIVAKCYVFYNCTG